MRVLKPVLSTPSTVLIPQHLMKLLKSGNKRDMRMYLRYLLSLKYPVLESKKWKRLYQKQGLKLQRVSFRPFEEDWQKLCMISQASGVSSCMMFVILMNTDIQDQVPTNKSHQTWELKVCLVESTTILIREIFIEGILLNMDNENNYNSA